MQPTKLVQQTYVLSEERGVMTDETVLADLEEAIEATLKSSPEVLKLALNSSLPALRRYQLACDYASANRRVDSNWEIIFVSFFVFILDGVIATWAGFYRLYDSYGLTPGTSRAVAELLIGFLLVFFASGLNWWLVALAPSNKKAAALSALMETARDLVDEAEEQPKPPADLQSEPAPTT